MWQGEGEGYHEKKKDGYIEEMKCLQEDNSQQGDNTTRRWLWQAVENQPWIGEV